MAVKSTIHRSEIAIAGGGPVGLTLALALARRGYESVVIDATTPRRPGQGVNGPADSRAFFVAYGCWRIFRALGLEEALLPNAEPVTSVEAQGGAGGISFLADECSEPVLGYMVESIHLAPVLHAAVKAQPGVTLVAPSIIEGANFGDAEAVLNLSAGEARACLAIGCEGAKSAVRKAAGLRFEGRDHDAKAISTTVLLSSPHKGVARQIFLPGGPLAVLPLKDGRANLIWTERASVADALLALDDTDFEAELAKRTGTFLEGARLAGRRQSFPVSVYVAERFHAPRAALAGDAAHVVHPLGGQGLNLGLKDAAALVDVIDTAGRAGLDIGSELALDPYTRWRRADVVAAAAAMEGFARTFSGPLPVQLAAGLAMQAAGTVREVRTLFTREAGGDLGDLPSLMART